MSKFYKGQRVIVKDNPTWGGGKTFEHIDPLGEARPGNVLIVTNPDPDRMGDIEVKPVSENSWFLISEDSVVSDDDVHVGDRICATDFKRDVVVQGTVVYIGNGPGTRGVYVGKDPDNAAYVGRLGKPERYGFTVLERVFKWPDHEGFIWITGGKRNGERAIAYKSDDGEIYVRRVTGISRRIYAREFDPEFDFEYVEG